MALEDSGAPSPVLRPQELLLDPGLGPCQTTPSRADSHCLSPTTNQAWPERVSSEGRGRPSGTLAGFRYPRPHPAAPTDGSGYRVEGKLTGQISEADGPNGLDPAVQQADAT